MQLIMVFGIAFAIGAVVFSLQNNSPVLVTIAVWTFEGSLALVLLVSLALGVLIAGLVSSPAVIRRQWSARRLRGQVADLERQLAQQQQRTRELEEALAGQSPEAASVVPAAEKPYVGLRALLSGAEGRATSPHLESPREDGSR